MITSTAATLIAAVTKAKAPHAYLMRIVRNRGIDILRQASRLVPLDGHDAAGLEQPFAFVDVAAIVAELSADERRLLTMRFWDRMRIAEIAEKLELPYSTVAKRLVRLVDRLRSKYGRAAPF